ncbi:hypothetical protein ACWDA9_38695, partial [Streptomyces sp. NPDC001193]
MITPAGKRKGQNPDPAGAYRARAEHEKLQAYPETAKAAHADHATLRPNTATGQSVRQKPWLQDAFDALVLEHLAPD